MWMPTGTIQPAAHPPTISTDFPGNQHHKQPLLSKETLEKNINLLEYHRGARSPRAVTSPQAVTEPGREELVLGE